MSEGALVLLRLAGLPGESGASWGLGERWGRGDAPPCICSASTRGFRVLKCGGDVALDFDDLGGSDPLERVGLSSAAH